MKKQILFVCTGNSCRSVMAEGLFKHFTKGREAEFSVISAGISAMDGYNATEETIRVMRDEGIDVSGHKTKRLTIPMILTADEIFAMETFHQDWILRTAPEVEGRVHLMTDFLENPTMRSIPDPIRMPESFYKSTMNVISNCVKRIIQEKF